MNHFIPTGHLRLISACRNVYMCICVYVYMCIYVYISTVRPRSQGTQDVYKRTKRVKLIGHRTYIITLNAEMGGLYFNGWSYVRRTQDVYYRVSTQDIRLGLGHRTYTPSVDPALQEPRPRNRVGTQVQRAGLRGLDPGTQVGYFNRRDVGVRGHIQMRPVGVSAYMCVCVYICICVCICVCVCVY